MFPCIQTEAIGIYIQSFGLFYKRSGVLNDISRKFSTIYNDLWDRPSLRLFYMEYFPNIVKFYAMSTSTSMPSQISASTVSINNPAHRRAMYPIRAPELASEFLGCFLFTLNQIEDLIQLPPHVFDSPFII